MPLVHPLKAAATALLAALAMPGPHALAEELPSERKVRYGCHGEFDHRQVTALFFNQPPAEVILLLENGQAGAVRLPQQRSASGARFSDGNESFWVKGDSATWQRGGTYQCKASRPPR